MSAKISGLIWEVGPAERATRFVLLAIADNSGDDGFAYPGIALLCRKTLFEERHVMRAIQKLETEGWLRVVRRTRGGKGNEYYIDVERLESLKDEARSRDKMSPEKTRSTAKKSGDISDSGDILNTSQVTSTTDSGDICDNHILKNRQEPSLETPKDNKGPLFPAWLPLDLWQDFRDMRKKIKKPMTAKAEELAIRKLGELREQGHAAELVLEQSILRSWQGLFRVEREDGSNGRRNYQSKGERTVDATRNVAQYFADRDGARNDGIEEAGDVGGSSSGDLRGRPRDSAIR